MKYNWQQSDWPEFRYDLSGIEQDLIAYQQKLGKLHGLVSALSAESLSDTIVDLMVMEAINTSEIEGEVYSRIDVMSSVKNNLGLNNPSATVKNPGAAGIAELMSSVRDHWAEPLTQKQLFDWHQMVLVNAPRQIQVGQWRTHSEPMQIVSGAIGKVKVYFEAPASERVPSEMQQWLLWFNQTAPDGATPILQSPVRAALAHLYFESIHPFEDGNGRIGRAIAEKALAQGAKHPVLFSLSKAIYQCRSDYYNALKTAQKSNEATEWVTWFVTTLLQALDDAERQIQFTLKKSAFLNRYQYQLNSRQEKVLLRMLAEGPDGFKGGMSQSIYHRITGASPATATRDLASLTRIGALVSSGGGRSRRYHLPFAV
jgi:Fic family protein